MEKSYDIDDVLLCKARQMLPHVRTNGHPEATCTRLDDVPHLVVLVFELLTTESIPEALKPFSTLRDRASTLQMIIDTLEKMLKLPLSHVTGMGVAQLERRHIGDLLQILDDLVRHCYPESNANYPGGGNLEGRRLTLSQLESPDWRKPDVDISDFSTPPLSVMNTQKGTMFRDDHHLQPMDKRAPAHRPRSGENNQMTSPETSSHYVHMAPGPTKHVQQAKSNNKEYHMANNPKHVPTLKSQPTSQHSIGSETQIHPKRVDILKYGQHESPTFLKKFHRGFSPYSRDKARGRSIPYSPMIRSVNKPIGVKARKPSVKSFSSPVQHSSVHSSSVNRRSKPKYVLPEVEYLKTKHVSKNGDRQCTKRMGGNNSDNNDYEQLLAPVNNIHDTNHKQMYTTKRTDRCTERSESARRPPPPPHKSALKHVKISTQKSYSSNQGLLSPIQTIHQRSTLRPHVKEKTSRNRVTTRPTSMRARSSSKPAVQDSTLRKSTMNTKPRRQSVVSTKVRRHSRMGSNGSPGSVGGVAKHPVKRGDISPQTESLCSSIKLLEEFDYVKRRLTQIQQMKHQHEEAIRDLEREEIRLNYVLSHVHGEAGRVAVQ